MDTNTDIISTAEQIQQLLRTPLIPCNTQHNTLTLTNAQARRLLALARKGLEIAEAQNPI